MAGAAGGVLAANVTRAGAFGFIAAGHTPISHLKAQVGLARQTLGLGPTEPLPLGIGLLFWRLESTHGDPSTADEFLQYIVNECQPKAIWLSFGQDLKRWVEKIIALDDKRLGESGSKQTTARRLKVLVGVYTTQQAVEVSQWGTVDIIEIQGTESGGHGPSYQVGLPTISAVPVLAKAFSNLDRRPLLVAAGGLASGQHLLTALALGADGAVFGTLFLATPEALYNDEQKQLVKDSKGEDTVRTMAFDHARGTLGWGDGVDGRGLRNDTSDEANDVCGSEQGRKRYDDAVKQGDVKRIVTWSTSVGLVDKIQPAADWVLEIERDAMSTLERLNSLRC
ncbi:hypothetical protein OIV83_006055 [Microbotryomycetes sp. JL201]|nr:hypothetical protein OIV83_006055 [Microbotryomycetes sp. JL201]